MPTIEVNQEDKQPTQQGISHRRGITRLVRKFAPWVGLALPFAVHLRLAVRNLRLAYHQVIPRFTEVSGSGLVDWLRTYGILFARAETWPVMARMYSMWIVVFLVLSIYGALRAKDNVLDGVSKFLAHCFAAALILAVITPALWILMGPWGPGVVELIPAVVLLFIGVLLTNSALHGSP